MKENNRKILILGSPGVGKTYFSNRLSEKTNIKVYHLDDYYWRENWESLTEQEWKEVQLEILSHDEFIVDGNYINSLSLRIKYTETIIYIDSTIFFAIKGVIKRTIKNFFGLENELPVAIMTSKQKKLTEKGLIPFIVYVIKYNLMIKKKVISELRRINNRNVIVLNHSELDEYLEGLN